MKPLLGLLAFLAALGLALGLSFVSVPLAFVTLVVLVWFLTLPVGAR